MKRKLTGQEQNELRGTTMVKQRNKDEKPVTFEDFEFLMVIGRGTFGKVFLVELKTTKKMYCQKRTTKECEDTEQPREKRETK